MVLDARSVLVADGVGCLAAAAVTAASDSVAELVLPASSWRAPVGAALGATGVMLLASARTRPTARDLRRAALVNVGWVGTCALMLRHRPSRWGTALLATTALFDGAAAVLQWRSIPGARP